jgi:hypothetical protein
MPLLMHAATLADPLDPQTKEFKRISGKKSKTEDDHELMSMMEFAAGLYLDDDGRPCIPAGNLMKCLIEGARVTKSGPKIERGVTLAGVDFPLIYDGPTDPADLYQDRRFVDRRSVVNQRARVMRTRPVFKQWAFEAEAHIDPAILDVSDLASIVTDAGNLIGLGDHRKIGGYGRFTGNVAVI